MANKDEIYVDPNFFLPPNVYDFRYSEKQNGNDTPEVDTQQSEEVIVNPDGDGTTYSNPESTAFLLIPESISVVSQTVKAAAGGGYLVDLVIEIPDMNGVENFDVAVTKA